MKRIILLCAFIFGMAGTLIAQPGTIDIFALSRAYSDAMKNNAPIEEKRKIAAQLKTYLLTDKDETLFKYTYIGDLLKDSDNPQDVQEAVRAYDYFLRNTQKNGYNFPNDYPEQEQALALLLISKYYYYTLTGELPFDVRYTVAEAVRWFEGPLDGKSGSGVYERTQLETAAKNIMTLQQWRLPGSKPQAYAATMEVIKRYSGLFLCDLGEVIKYNNKKQAFKKLALWYNEVETAGLPAFKTVARTIETHYLSILNFFNNRSTNASAESFNAKIKAFRATSRGVRDIPFFLFRLANIYA